jgi:diadenylate cyclase
MTSWEQVPSFLSSSRSTPLSSLISCYLDAVAAQVDVPLGLGSRHIAAANMSAVTKAVGIVVSESSVVRLFCHGQLVGEIIPEIWMMDHAQLRGTAKREQVGELTILTPNLRPASIAK